MQSSRSDADMKNNQSETRIKTFEQALVNSGGRGRQQAENNLNTDPCAAF